MARNRIHNWLERKKIDKLEQFYAHGLGDILIGALLKANLAEPLDSIDMPEADKARARETY